MAHNGSGTTRVLVIEDDIDGAEFLKVLLEHHGYAVHLALNGKQAREALETWRPELVLMDLMLPDAAGLELLKVFRDSSPEIPIIVVSGHGSIAIAVEAMERGALSFVEKPVNPPVLLATLAKATEKRALTAENRRLKATVEDVTTFGNIIARSMQMRQVLQLVKSVAPTDASVLVHGESGTGKELVAAAIHQQSKRAKGPFIKVNCAAIPSELIESELFGHKRGSFTGALTDKSGLMELADGGTLLLDEIGEMAPGLQAKLLRVLQDKEFRPVGGNKILKVNFRLICATNVELDRALTDGKLREDLYFRINTVTIWIPPLRKRPDDIALLADRFLDRFTAQHQREIASIHPQAAKALLRYQWPGNVRELEHVIERAVILAQQPVLMLEDLPPKLGVEHQERQESR